MTCKNCYHCDVCHLRISLNMDYDEVKDKPITEMEKRCEYFKNKSRIIELPYKVLSTKSEAEAKLKELEK